MAPGEAVDGPRAGVVDTERVGVVVGWTAPTVAVDPRAPRVGRGEELLQVVRQAGDLAAAGVHLEGLDNQPRLRGHARQAAGVAALGWVAARQPAIAQDGAGDVGTVADSVVPRRTRQGQGGGDAPGEVRAEAAQVAHVQPRVGDGDNLPRPEQPPRPRPALDAHDAVTARHVVVRAALADGSHPHHVGQVGQRLHRRPVRGGRQ